VPWPGSGWPTSSTSRGGKDGSTPLWRAHVLPRGGRRHLREDLFARSSWARSRRACGTAAGQRRRRKIARMIRTSTRVSATAKASMTTPTKTSTTVLPPTVAMATRRPSLPLHVSLRVRSPNGALGWLCLPPAGVTATPRTIAQRLPLKIGRIRRPIVRKEGDRDRDPQGKCKDIGHVTSSFL